MPYKVGFSTPEVLRVEHPHSVVPRKFKWVSLNPPTMAMVATADSNSGDDGLWKERDFDLEMNSTVWFFYCVKRNLIGY